MFAGAPQNSKTSDKAAHALAAMGLEIQWANDDDDGKQITAAPEFEIWPENDVPVRLMGAMFTQWQIGPGGAVGLRYDVLPVVASLIGISKLALRRAFDQVRVCEDEVLAICAERREE